MSGRNMLIGAAMTLLGAGCVTSVMLSSHNRYEKFQKKIRNEMSMPKVINDTAKSTMESLRIEGAVKKAAFDAADILKAKAKIIR